jgi:hypothetical protein
MRKEVFKMKLNGVWVNRDDPEEQIIVERVYKKRDDVDFFYFMCKYTGGGTISKIDLINKYEKRERGKRASSNIVDEM